MKRAVMMVLPSDNFSVSTADGGSFRVGDGTGEPLAIRFMTVSAELVVLLDPDLRFAELYVDGEIVLERGSLAGLLAMLLSQDRTANPTLWATGSPAAEGRNRGPTPLTQPARPATATGDL
jgi:cyclopropane-fatty-acyl-phospholipid synthase